MDKDSIATLDKSEPQRRLPADGKDPKPGGKPRWWIWPLVLVLLAYGGYLLNQSVNKQKAAAASTGKGGGKKGGDRNIPVVAIGARRGDIPVYLNGLGSVTAFNTVTVKSRVDGQLIKVAYVEGQFVKAGDLLAEIDPRPFQDALQQAQAAFEKDTAAVAQAQANLARDQAQAKNAQAEADRYAALTKEGVVSRQQNEAVQTTLGTQQQTLHADEAAIRSAQATLEGDKATIQNAKLNLSYCTIRSPLTGRIGLRLVDQGNMIHASDPNGLAVVAQLQPIAVLFTIPEDYLQPVLKSLRSGAHLPVDAYDRDFKTKLASGVLLTVDNTIDQSTGTSRLKGQFPNQDSALFPNQFVNVRLLMDTKHDAVIIPSAAVQRGPQGTFAYVVGDDKKAMVRPVTLGPTEGNDVAIDKGLEVSELVVVDGADKLQDGSPVSMRVPGQDNGPGGGQPGGKGRKKRPQAAE